MTDLNHTSQEKYKDVLLEVAREVYDCVFGTNDNTLLQRLRDALRDLATQEKKHIEYRKGQSVVLSDMQIPDKYRSLITRYFSLDRKRTPPLQPSERERYIRKDGKKIKLWPSPLTHHRIVLSPAELSKEEAEHRDLIGLSCIYDNCRVRIGKQDKINDSIVPEDTYKATWRYISGEPYFYEGKAEFMRSALRSIQPAQTPVKTDDTADEIPADLIKLKVAIAEYKVGRGTLINEIGLKSIKSYRDKNAKKNAPYLVSRADIMKYGRRKVEIVHKHLKDNEK